MRFTRAAKVAAFPLLAMVLVVALIACQGPVGKAGDAGKKGDTGVGTPGTNADPAFQAMAVPVQIFNTMADDSDAETTGQTLELDLDDYVANAEGDVSFEIIDISGWVETETSSDTQGSYELDGSMLTLSVNEPFTPAAAHARDSVIRVEATDNGDSAVLYVRVRGNVAPAGSGVLELTIGTQAAPADDSDEPDYVDSDNEMGARVTCAMLNVCTVDLIGVMGQTDVFMDVNLRDTLTFHVFEDSDLVEAVETATGVMIKGLKSGSATVVVWATDEAGMPMLAEEDDTANDGIDETMRPLDNAAYVITVTVDGAPFMSDSAVGTKSITVEDMAAVVGTVFDDDVLTAADLSFEPDVGEQGSDTGAVARIIWADGTAATIAGLNRREISVDGLNDGTVTLTVKVTEDDEAVNNPTQYVEHMITVTVST